MIDPHTGDGFYFCSGMKYPSKQCKDCSCSSACLSDWLAEVECEEEPQECPPKDMIFDGLLYASGVPKVEL